MQTATESSQRVNRVRVGRVAISVVFGLICFFSGFWWIRSYWYIDSGLVTTFPGQYVAFHGGNGRMCVWFEHSAASRWFDWRSRPNGWGPGAATEGRMPWFDVALFWPRMTRLYIAHWVMMVVAGLIAVAPWCPRKPQAGRHQETR